MENENILEKEITEKKKATTKKKVASSSKEEDKKTETKKTTAKKAPTEKKTTTKKSTKTETAKKASEKKTTAKKATTTKSTTKKTTTKKASDEKKTNKSTKAAETKTTSKKESLEKLLSKKIVDEPSLEVNEEATKEQKEETLNAPEVVDVSEDVKTIEEPKEELKKFDLPKKNTDPLKVNTPLDAQELDHVTILKKKMEAQKKLKENNLNDAPLVKSENPYENISYVDAKQDAYQEENKALSNEVENLKLENEKLKNEISGLMADINDKEEKLIILTNSMVGKTSEEELAKEVELLRKENKELQDKIDTISEVAEQGKSEVPDLKLEELTKTQNVDMLSFEVIDKGEISLRIKLLNERIAEKENQIKLVEEELNSLTEKDIVAEGFASEIKDIRKKRKENIAQANLELNELAKLVKSSESKLIAKQEAYNEKCEEIKQFDKKLKEQQLSYTEKETQLTIRSILYAEKDSLFVEIESHESNYKKLLNRYKVRLESAEASLEKQNQAEANLINRYLNQLREDKSNSNEDYQMQIIERNALYQELDKLKKNLEDAPYEEEKLSFEQFDLENLKAGYAKVTGKISQIRNVYAEREKIEKILLKNEQSIRDYYDAFKNRETVMFNINENNLRINALEEKINKETDDVKKELIKNRVEAIRILVEDDKEKANYYNSIIEKLREDEKVAFYIKLINSMIELKDKEKELSFKANNIKKNIEKVEAE